MRFNDNNYEAAFIKSIVRNNYVSESNVEKREVPFGERLLNQSTNYIPETDYYDTGTHEALGNYLRYVRDFYDVDLMSLYNCFSNHFIGTGSLPIKEVGGKIVFDDYKEQFVTTCFPIKKRATYRIYFKESNTSTIIIQPGLFHNGNLIGSKKFDAVQMHSTFFEYKFTDALKDGDRDKPVYLFIQYSRDTSYPPVITEVIDEKSYNALNNTLIDNADGRVAFSDTLLEYLSGNAISPFNTEAWDILKIQNMLASLYKDFKYTPGVFDDMMHKYIFNKYSNNGLHDFLGYVDKNVEELIIKEREAKVNENSKSGG